MAAEAVHLSALTDSCDEPGMPGELCHLLASREGRAAARLGAVMVDLPYFRNFPMAALRFALKRPQLQSEWGNTFHRQCPIAVGRALLEASQALRERRRLGRARQLLALALGYFSHLAVDTVTHPYVNRMARERMREGGTEESHHQTIEKFQSVLFHEARNGFDFMGKDALREYIRIESALLGHDSELFESWRGALGSALGAAPSRREFRNWARGYTQYGWLIASPIGKTLAPQHEKDEELPKLYDGPTFSYPRLFERAVDRVRSYFEAAWAFAHGAPFDDEALPEGCIDDPPFPEQAALV